MDIITLEYLKSVIPVNPLQQAMGVIATTIDYIIDESQSDTYNILLATPTIPLIECNYSISRIDRLDDVYYKIYERINELTEFKAKYNHKKKPTTNRQIITIVNSDGQIITNDCRHCDLVIQYMNSCVQYNVIGCDSKLYRVKRFRTGKVQIPDSNNFEICRDVIDKIMVYESNIFNEVVTSTHKYSYNLINYKFKLVNDLIIDMNIVYKYFNAIMNKRMAELKNFDNLPYIEDLIANNTLDDSYLTICNINNKSKNSVLYIAFLIRVRSLEEARNKKAKKISTFNTRRKKITVAISYNTCFNIQGGMSILEPTYLIYNYLIDVFRTNTQFYKHRIQPDKPDVDIEETIDSDSY
jgi:hypothetical protein